MEYKPSNREKSFRAKRRKFWCGTCDAAIVGVGERCPKCGVRETGEKKRLKKYWVDDGL